MPFTVMVGAVGAPIQGKDLFPLLQKQDAQLCTHQGTQRFTLVSFSLFSEQCSLQSALCVHKDLGEAIFYQQRRNIHPQKNLLASHNYHHHHHNYDNYDNHNNYDQPRFIFVQHAFATSSAILVSNHLEVSSAFVL